MNKLNTVVQRSIENKIYIIRDQKVMLDKDLAELYGVDTRRLKESVRRNLERFPIDFMFELTENEYKCLRSQIATSNEGRGGTRYLPMAFTEYGVLMLSSVLNSARAIQVNIQIMRIFARIRQLLSDNIELRLEIEQIKKKVVTIDSTRDAEDAKNVIKEAIELYKKEFNK